MLYFIKVEPKMDNTRTENTSSQKTDEENKLNALFDDLNPDDDINL